MPKSILSCIYLDMDGVLCDFDKRYKELFGITAGSARDKKEFHKYFDIFIQKRSFETLDALPGAMDLVEFLRKASVPTQILSSTANEENYDAISKQKLIWLQTHGITFKPNFVPGKKHKWKFAGPDKLIIDDTQSVIDDWRKAGGLAIWHQDMPTTLGILKMYV